MFSRSSRKRLSSRSVSVPHQSGADLRVPLGRRELPCRVSLRPAAAHLWPQVSRPRWRAGVRPERAGGLQGEEGVKSDPQPRGEGDQELWPTVSQFGAPSEALSLASSFQADPNPTTKPQGPASWRSSRGLDFGSVFWGVLCCLLPGSTSLFQGERHCCFSGDSGERSCFCFLETRDQGVSGRQSPSHDHFLMAWCLHQRQPAWVGTPFPTQETILGHQQRPAQIPHL